MGIRNGAGPAITLTSARLAIAGKRRRFVDATTSKQDMDCRNPIMRRSCPLNWVCVPFALSRQHDRLWIITTVPVQFEESYATAAT